MSWPRALVYVAAAAILAVVYFATAPPPPPPPAASAAAASVQAGPVIDSVRLVAGGRTVRATRSGEQWEVVEPTGGTIPSDLIAALVSAVLDTRAEPVVADADRLTDFGLDTPSAQLTFGRADAPPITLVLGSANPAETGVYGRLEGNPQIVLLGLNVRYYIELVLKQSGG